MCLEDAAIVSTPLASLYVISLYQTFIPLPSWTRERFREAIDLLNWVRKPFGFSHLISSLRPPSPFSASRKPTLRAPGEHNCTDLRLILIIGPEPLFPLRPRNSSRSG